jgi:hypothetical protein
MMGWLDRILRRRRKPARPVEHSVRMPTRDEWALMPSARDGWFYHPALYRRRRQREQPQPAQREWWDR